MGVQFAEASQDERGKYSGGQAGDQTGKEVRVSNAYNHKLGWRIFRHPNANTAKWIGTNALNIANNAHFGYDQGQRDTGYNACKNAGWEPRNVHYDVELDCSSMVRTCIACALEKDISNFNTSTEASVLLSLGFREITGTALSALQLGDILVTKTKGHTVTVCSGATSSTTSVTTSTKANTYYQVITTAGKNYAEVKNNSDYAGVHNQPVAKVALRVDKGTVYYQVHVLGEDWLPYVTGYNWWDNNNGYAGNGKIIDGFRAYTEGTGGQIKYQVSVVGNTSFLPTVTEATDYAGIFGKPIDCLKIWSE